MPKAIEERIRAEGIKKGFTGQRLAHYVYGALNNIGAMHGSKETEKGKSMERKYMADHTKIDHTPTMQVHHKD